MKSLFFFTISTLFFTKITNQNTPIIVSNPNLNGKMISNKMKIKIGSETFIATLYDNETVAAFKTMLPLTLTMSDLNSNEKYAQLPKDLPTNKIEVGSIQEGDLMIWGANTLVIIYKTFKTSYQYTKIGHIDNPHRLASTVASRNLTISFELE